MSLFPNSSVVLNLHDFLSSVKYEDMLIKLDIFQNVQATLFYTMKMDVHVLSSSKKHHTNYHKSPYDSYTPFQILQNFG